MDALLYPITGKNDVVFAMKEANARNGFNSTSFRQLLDVNIVEMTMAGNGNGNNNNYSIRDNVLMASMSIKEQNIALVSSTKVMVAPAGGGSMIALFLPRHATLVLLSDHQHGPLNFPFFNNLAHLHVHYVMRDYSSHSSNGNGTSTLVTLTLTLTLILTLILRLQHCGNNKIIVRHIVNGLKVVQ